MCGPRDISYIPMQKGFVYLVAVVDWFGRRVLSHRVAISMVIAWNNGSRLLR